MSRYLEFTLLGLANLALGLVTLNHTFAPPTINLPHWFGWLQSSIGAFALVYELIHYWRGKHG